MKNAMLVGVTVGVIAATAIYQKSMQKKSSAFSRGMNAVMKKLENILE